jgi:outer membrane protein OmpA-like peptidoglycan-associated protein
VGTRSRLFASAAFPLLSLSLMLQPAHAALLAGQASTATIRQTNTDAAFQVAQAAPEPADGDQDPKKKKKPGEEPGKEPPKAEKPAAEPAAPKPPKAEKPAEPEAPKPPKAEKPAETEAPKPPKAAAAPEAAPVKPKAAEPAPAAPKAAAEPEAPKPPKPAKPAAAAEPEAAPVKPKPAAAAEPEVQPETKKPQKPTAEQPAEPAVKPKAEAPAAAAPTAEPAAPAAEAPQPPKKHQKPADVNGEAAPAAEPVIPGEKPAKPQQPAEQVVPNAEKPVEPKAEGAKPVTPAGEPAPAAAGQKPAAPAAAPPASPADGKAAPAKGNAPANEAAPAQNGAAAPQAAPSTAGQQVSPAEIERRQKIADNPAAAGAGAGPVILPVQNGTAVLDSDKDRHGHRGKGGNGQPAPGGNPPAAGQAQGQAAPGQVPGDQRPPAPANVRAPTSDADSQRAPGGNQAPPVKIQAVTSEQGQRMDKRPDFAAPDGARVGDRQDNRVIINFGDDEFVRHDDTQRFTRDGERPTYEQLPRDRYRETIDRPDGDRIITVRNRYGDIIQRSRIDARGREYVLFYSPELEQTPDQDDYYRDPGDALPPMRLRIPLNQYIIDTSEDQNQDYYDFLRKPPVEPVERVYSLNEVRYSARLRDKVRRIDLDTITFATGSADVPMAQAKTLRGIADAIGNIVKKDPTETFLIEGHTDAVGTDQSNLILSDQRAESVANVLTDVYGIPPENLATQGYGEQYLKINTDGPQQENRRVTIRRVTALVRPVAAK